MRRLRIDVWVRIGNIRKLGLRNEEIIGMVAVSGTGFEPEDELIEVQTFFAT